MKVCRNEAFWEMWFELGSLRTFQQIQTSQMFPELRISHELHFKDELLKRANFTLARNPRPTGRLTELNADGQLRARRAKHSLISVPGRVEAV